ncbi:acyl-CoA dehydrogenase [Streptomyces sp. NBC_00091]|uniref:acyl-CoA dehydrogenase n=1 Tax=Streptomyces sp. NBC_00091 TaxID=2975648 RepID=UPI00225AF1D4|nr:acyl-CoA dehydrogenase [Streptomyces sp. NBC_00091]MCX5381005.1 acyl-CoA dehydrogenase [Streptomyces sp. NBC_00091]
MHYAPLAAAEAFERSLGDPHDPARPFSFARGSALDAAEEFPEAACALLDSLRLHHHYVPERHGGRLTSYEDVLQLVRMVARRDLTVAVAHGKTFLGAVCAWVGADDAQARALGARILAGDAVAWGLTERDHGSDLMAGEVTAAFRPGDSDGDSDGGDGGGDGGDGGYRLSGEKWLINNATRGRLVAVLARTDPDPDAGGRAFDVLLADKDALPPGTYRTLPKVRTLGIRGADISGIAFDAAPLPASARMGAPGTGLATVLKGLQLTRTLCASLALGAGDHALRIAVRWAARRELYGRRLDQLPRARRVLADAYADQLAAEALAVVATRTLHTAPGELAALSAAVKYLLPVRAEASVAALGELLGARSLLSGPDAHAQGRFEKVRRDAGIVALFDGSTVVNLHAIVSQFPLLARAPGRGGAAGEPGAATDLTRPLPPFDPAGLDLVARRGCAALRALPAVADDVEALARRRPELADCAALVRRLAGTAAAVHARLAALPPASRTPSAEHFRTAEDWARCLHGAAAAGLWLASHPYATGEHAEDGLWSDGLWLRAVLRRLLGELGAPQPPDGADEDALLAHLWRQERDGALFSLFPCRLAEGARA